MHLAPSRVVEEDVRTFALDEQPRRHAVEGQLDPSLPWPHPARLPAYRTARALCREDMQRRGQRAGERSRWRELERQRIASERGRAYAMRAAGHIGVDEPFRCPRL